MDHPDGAYVLGGVLIGEDEVYLVGLADLEDCFGEKGFLGVVCVVDLLGALVDGELLQRGSVFLDVLHEFAKSKLVEVALEGDGDGIGAADCTGGKGFFQFQGHYFIDLILNEVALHLLLLSPQVLQHLDDLDSTHDGVGAGNGGYDVAGHILHLVEGLLLNAEAEHTQVGCAGDEVDDVVVVLLEYHCSLLPFHC